MKPRRFLFVISLLLSGAINAQYIYFRGQAVDTIDIFATSWSFHFDDKGTTSGRSNSYKIAFDKSDNQYKLFEYRKTKNISTFKPETYNEKSRKIAEGDLIDREKIKSLLLQLDMPSNADRVKASGISPAELTELTQVDRLIKKSKKYDIDWRFKAPYMEAKKNQMILAAMQKQDTFRLYLDEAFNSSYPIITDAGAGFLISIYAGKVHYLFEGKFPNPFFLPWYEHNEEEDYKTLFNPGLNKALRTILPKNFVLSEKLATEALIDEYLIWYCKRQQWLYDAY